MRVNAALGTGNEAECINWAKYLLKIGNGEEPTRRKDLVEVPRRLLLPPRTDNTRAGKMELIDYVYGTQIPQISVRPDAAATSDDRAFYSQELKKLCKYYQNKVLLTPTNNAVSQLNEIVMQKLPGRQRIQ